MRPSRSARRIYLDGTWSTSCSSSHRRSRRGKCAARPPPRAVLTLPPRAVLALPPRAPASAPRTTARAPPPRTTARPVPPPRCSHCGRAPTHGAFARVAHTQVVCGVISVRRVRGSAVWVCGGRGGSRVRAGTGQVGWTVGMWGGSGTVRLARGPASGPASLVVSLINPRRSAPVPHFSGRSAAGVPRFLGPRGPAFGNFLMNFLQQKRSRAGRGGGRIFDSSLVIWTYGYSTVVF